MPHKLPESVLPWRLLIDNKDNPNTFLVACAEAENKVHKSIVRQLLAVENFVLFKSMMVARNKALNEEALKEM